MTVMAVMEIDGITRTFEIPGVSLGTGIFGEGTDVELILSSRNNADEPFRQQGIILSYPFGQTGQDLISQFTLSESFFPDFNNITFDFLQGEFQSNIERNSESCFVATFSGRVVLGDEQSMIEDGELFFILNERFEDDFLFP